MTISKRYLEIKEKISAKCTSLKENSKNAYVTTAKRVRQYLNEILILIGLFFIVFPTYMINMYAGMYLTGVLFIAIGVFFAKFPPRKGGYD